MTKLTTGRYIALTAILATLLGVGSVIAAPKIATVKVSGSFDIPKKEYKVGETVRGKFIFVNQARPMTVTVKRWDGKRFIVVKKNVKLKKGERSSSPVEWKVEKSGKQVIQYQVDGSWQVGKKISGFTRTFDYVINDSAKKQPLAQAPLPVGPPPVVPNCDVFPADKLDSCTAYECQFAHPFTSGRMQRKILGIVGGKCKYVEEMPNNGQMACNYTEATRKVMAQYYRDSAAAASARTRVEIDVGSGTAQTTYTIDGKKVANPLQEAMNTGVCVISGYGR